MINLKGRKVAITGGSSMIARHLVPVLKNRGAIPYLIYHTDYDLREYTDCIHALDWNVDYLIHTATYSGGIRFNIDFPADTFINSSLMNLNVLRAANTLGIRKVLGVMSNCCIPNLLTFNEEHLWNGQCGPTVECHGVAKRNLDVAARCLNKQYGLNAVNTIMVNSFGTYDKTDYRVKAIGGLIIRFIKAKREGADSVTCLGTGNVYREYIYAPDAAACLVQLLERYEEREPVNLSSGKEISIKDLAYLIAHMVGFDGEICWDTTQPDGDYRRQMDLTKMNKYIDLEFTPFEKALKETIEWYQENC